MLITSTQAELAQLAGSSRESASRFLAVLERAGIITQGRGRLVVHDPGGASPIRLLMAAEEFSAGGVVVRDGPGGGDRAGQARRPAAGRVLGLPKGHPEGGESPERGRRRERSARRPGSRSSSSSDLGEVEYQYERRRGRRVAKRVAFFLFAHRGGSFEDHDHEIEEARWMPLDEAAEALTYSGEREMVQRARSILAADR